MSAVEEAAELLRREGWRVQEPPPPPPVYSCAGCGESEDGFADLGLVDFTVRVADGEEGFALVRRFFCDSCVPDVCDKLIELGFESHKHGGINYLEASGGRELPCGGYYECKRAEGVEYGEPEEY